MFHTFSHINVAFTNAIFAICNFTGVRTGVMYV